MTANACTIAILDSRRQTFLVARFRIGNAVLNENAAYHLLADPASKRPATTTVCSRQQILDMPANERLADRTELRREDPSFLFILA